MMQINLLPHTLSPMAEEAERTLRDAHPILRMVAEAFAEADPTAGWSHVARSAGASESRDVRAANLIRCGYVLRVTDPGNLIAIVIGEPRGGPDDCEPPARYDDRWPVLRTPGLWWEWYDCAAGLVYFEAPEHD